MIIRQRQRRPALHFLLLLVVLVVGSGIFGVEARPLVRGWNDDDDFGTLEASKSSQLQHDQSFVDQALLRAELNRSYGAGGGCRERNQGGPLRSRRSSPSGEQLCSHEHLDSLPTSRIKRHVLSSAHWIQDLARRQMTDSRIPDPDAQLDPVNEASEESRDHIAHVTGGAAAGGITVIVVMCLTIWFLRVAHNRKKARRLAAAAAALPSMPSDGKLCTHDSPCMVTRTNSGGNRSLSASTARSLSFSGATLTDGTVPQKPQSAKLSDRSSILSGQSIFSSSGPEPVYGCRNPWCNHNGGPRFPPPVMPTPAMSMSFQGTGSVNTTAAYAALPNSSTPDRRRASTWWMNLPTPIVPGVIPDIPEPFPLAFPDAASSSSTIVSDNEIEMDKLTFAKTPAPGSPPVSPTSTIASDKQSSKLPAPPQPRNPPSPVLAYPIPWRLSGGRKASIIPEEDEDEDSARTSGRASSVSSTPPQPVPSPLSQPPASPAYKMPDWS